MVEYYEFPWRGSVKNLDNQDCRKCLSGQSLRGEASSLSSVFVPFSHWDFYNRADDNDDDQSEEEAKMKYFEEFKSRLNPVDKTLVSLYLEEIEYREISQITGLSEANARTRIHRIKKQIKKDWEEKYGA